METHAKYKTKQRETLLEYLRSVQGTHITAADVLKHFKDSGTPMGQATVYRQLESLVDDGFLNKYIIDAGSPACFEYVNYADHVEGEQCFHCKCEGCGRLIHLHCDELAAIGAHLQGEHGFRLDPLRTVFYGLCEECTQGVTA